MAVSFRCAALASLTVLAGLSAAPASAGPYILFEAQSGDIIAQHDPLQSWYPASITKLMTTYVVFRALSAGTLRLTSPVRISQNALSEPPSKMGFQVGTVMNVDNALKMMLVKSANDIAVAIAESVAGSEAAFVKRMNDEAARLGMTGTRFTNPNGLPDEGQVTTARDLAVLARALWTDFPEHRGLFSISAIRYGKITIRNYNSLLELYPGTDGMKTGFICASGFNVVASATRDGKTVIAVVLGESSAKARAESAGKLLNTGFSGWSGLFKRGTLDELNGAAVTPAVDMRASICDKKKGTRSEGEEFGEGEEQASALVPRFRLMEPVRVVTGLPAPETKVAKATEPAKPKATETAAVKTAEPAKPKPAATLPAKTAEPATAVAKAAVAVAKPAETEKPKAVPAAATDPAAAKPAETEVPKPTKVAKSVPLPRARPTASAKPELVPFSNSD